ncbi:MAG: asparagine synthase (glutamine-hydrolyzing), partial [Usitatibacter sp.]
DRSHVTTRAGLGFRRLAIQDLSPAGHQPMSFRDRYWIAFNGEVYNFPELRVKLVEAGYEFHTGSDTEVILAAYDAWGPGCLARFNGMWALAILDLATRRIFLARDRFGVKPLYYWNRDGSFVFGSEIKALLAWPGTKARPNEAYLRDWLRDGPREWIPQTAFEDIHRFPAGHYVLADWDRMSSGNWQPRRWWELGARAADEPFDALRASDYAEEYRWLLDSAVALRLRADVPVGAALSGGLDSSSIVALVRGQVADPARIQTFSSVYTLPGTEDCDESAYIATVARHLGVASHCVEPRVGDVMGSLEDVVRAMDSPPVDTLMSSWHTFRLVHSHGIKVTLDGQGADEMLAGYPPYLANRVLNAPAAEGFREAWRALLLEPGSSSAACLALRAAASVGGKPLASGMLSLAGRDPRPVLMPLADRLREDSVNYLSNLLHYADRTSMFHSVESRAPFMDCRLQEFVHSLPVAYRIHDGWRKWIARASFDGLLPKEIVWRRGKLGWPIPERAWFGGRLGAYIRRGKLERRLEWLTPALRRDAFQGSLTFRRRIRLLLLATWGEVFLGQR